MLPFVLQVHAEHNADTPTFQDDDSRELWDTSTDLRNRQTSIS